MAALVCEICGGKLIGKPGGMFECDSCGMEYSTEWAKAKIQEIKGTVKVEGTVEVQGTVKVEGPVKVEGAANAKSLLRRGQMALEDRKFEEAKTYFNQVLDIDPECGAAYWGLALAKERGSFYSLAEKCFEGKENVNVQRARKFADEETRAALEKLDATINETPARKKAEAERREAERIAKETRKADERMRREASLATVRQRISLAQGRLAAGFNHTVGVKIDGSVLAVGENIYGQCNVSTWTDIIAVSAGDHHTVGLKRDGTVLATGSNDYQQCDVSAWKNIVAIAAAGNFTVGLKSDGTVVFKGPSFSTERLEECCKWTNIVAISAAKEGIAGLKADGTVVAIGTRDSKYGIEFWRNITAVSAGDCTRAIKADGTIVSVYQYDSYKNYYGVSGDVGYVTVKAGHVKVALIKSDGTLEILGCDSFAFRFDDTDFVDVAIGFNHVVGLKSDGRVVGKVKRSHNNCGQCDVSDWKLFNSIDTLEQEIAAGKEAARRTRIARLNSEKAAARNELSNLNGLFSGRRRKVLEAKLAEIEKELKTLQ